ncbi:rCG62926 [Rattus norvegicus]|uniref:Ab2-060 n=2 Tax=Rattus norvegicus TaxID=10116 RepID=F7EPC6_RAT|nr:Ab2-060 [Rattus norvegicus]EDL77518.1 rCG62926 [Rattus norvegicus]|eukprot:NP_001041430.1 uncharacterized protein LOC501038 [Rattus norvegicus]
MVTSVLTMNCYKVYSVHTIKSGSFKVPKTDSVVKSKQDHTHTLCMEKLLLGFPGLCKDPASGVNCHAFVKSAVSKYEQKPLTALHFQVLILYNIEKCVGNFQKGGHRVDVYQYKT